jgi:hypothetical protein
MGSVEVDAACLRRMVDCVASHAALTVEHGGITGKQDAGHGEQVYSQFGVFGRIGWRVVPPMGLMQRERG